MEENLKKATKYMRPRAHHWSHISEERETFHPALKADKTLAKQGMTERLDMEEPSAKRHAGHGLAFSRDFWPRG